MIHNMEDCKKAPLFLISPHPIIFGANSRKRQRHLLLIWNWLRIVFLNNYPKCSFCANSNVMWLFLIYQQYLTRTKSDLGLVRQRLEAVIGLSSSNNLDFTNRIICISGEFSSKQKTNIQTLLYYFIIICEEW